ncbi:MAG: hypothetical protein NZM28_07990 [Fimbriimonadales bacterium]|nr:hypothetical protein [Fimbriimonadales bacterium]
MPRPVARASPPVRKNPPCLSETLKPRPVARASPPVHILLERDAQATVARASPPVQRNPPRLSETLKPL